jgi:hypothetical protein
MMNITGLSHLFKWENVHNWWLTKYFLCPIVYDVGLCEILISMADILWEDYVKC